EGAAWGMEGECGAAPGPEEPNGAAPAPAPAPASASAPAPAPARRRKASKKRKEAAAAIPRGRPKSGRVWKDPGKKRWARGPDGRSLQYLLLRRQEEEDRGSMWRSPAVAGTVPGGGRLGILLCPSHLAPSVPDTPPHPPSSLTPSQIRNPLKLKRAKKKQLRRVEKRDTLALLQKTPVQRKAATK
ncbi:CCD86 protein, partial [Podilymbus podiceps]|nr:CCD86 protein [Podilymbus podiceps]